MADLVVLSPHMDDETLGCGGVLALADDPVVIFGVDSPVVEARDIKGVSELLGFRYEILYEPDWVSKMGLIPRREFVGKVETILHAERPERVLIPFPSYHQDHCVMFEVGLAATRPLTKHGYMAPMVASYEYPGSAWRHDGGEADLNYYVDISSVIDNKLEAIDLYAVSQIGRGMVDLDIVKSWARLRGSFVGVEYAEAFRLLRFVEQGHHLGKLPSMGNLQDT